jgi:uncharacterized protein (DUF362 family)
MKIPSRPRVIIRRCSAYDAPRIRTLVREALEELDLRPHGRTLIKPNVVHSGPMFPIAHTRPEFVEGVIGALKDRDDGRVRELAVGERCGITIPTRLAFENAGYYPMFKRTGVKHYHFEEVPQVEIRLSHKERLRDYVFTPQPVADADFFVNCPKFKSHPWTIVTFSMKNYIGIQDDRHRLIDHDHRLHEKIADLQYIIQPQFIAIDGIVGGGGRSMLTPTPFDLGLVIMGNSQVAFDAVCCHIIGVDPRSVDYIRLAEDRGFGTTDLSAIDISGDVTLEEAQAKAKSIGFQVGLVRVEKYFEGTHISAYAGPPPEAEHTNYCWGGCPGAMQEAIEILRSYDKQCDDRMPRLHVVFGAYEGPIPAKPGEKVVFIGDCATWKGEIGDQLISIENLYKDRSTKDPYAAKHDDIYAKMMSVGSAVRKAKGESHMRIKGCPVSVAEMVLSIVSLGDELKNPYLNPTEIIQFNKGYLAWRGKMFAKSLTGQPYQVHGPCHRGEAAPDVTPPPQPVSSDAE